MLKKQPPRFQIALDIRRADRNPELFYMFVHGREKNRLLCRLVDVWDKGTYVASALDSNDYPTDITNSIMEGKTYQN